MQTPQNIAPNVPDRGALIGEILTPEDGRSDICRAIIYRRYGVSDFRISLAPFPSRIAENRVLDVEGIPDAHVIGASRANLSQIGR